MRFKVIAQSSRNYTTIAWCSFRGVFHSVRRRSYVSGTRQVIGIDATTERHAGREGALSASPLRQRTDRKVIESCTASVGKQSYIHVRVLPCYFCFSNLDPMHTVSTIEPGKVRIVALQL